MKSTMEILTKLQENSQKNHDEIFTRLYRYLLRPDIYFIAYQHLYSNKGAGTKGVNDDTADGFSEQYVTAIIEALRTGSYEPKPVRRTYIQKKNGKLRPLGLPVFADKLVQEAIRMILEAIYEPIFSIYSHGFRPGRSCHTALAMIKHEFTGAKWFIEGDIKGCFDNIDHSTLIGVLNRKIKDARFLNLIRMFLKSGYMEDWDFHETYSGCPQGGIISPILANVYLNELDRYITQLKKEFDHGYNPRNFTEEYNAIRHKRDTLTSSYGYPPTTLTGSVERDIVLIPPMIGVKVAVSDHRSSNPGGAELIALATAARRAGLLSGTPGLVTMHMGSGKAKLDPIFYVLDHSDVPAKNLLPTHMLRSPELIDAGVELVKRGGYIDCTAGSDEVAVKEDARKLFDLLHREGVNPDHVSLSSDAYGSQPRFNDAGECVGLTYASPKYLHKTIRALVRMGMPLEQALKLLTTTPATLLAQDGRKGCIAAGADADLLVLDEELEIDSLFARGQLALWQKELRMKGRFEE